MAKYSPADRERCCRMIESGTPVKVVATSTRISESTIRRWWRERPQPSETTQSPFRPQPEVQGDAVSKPSDSIVSSVPEQLELSQPEIQGEVDSKMDDRVEPATPELGRLPISNGVFITNHLNLAYILAAGLIMKPKDFGNKYYGDVLQQFPGWVPIFPGPIPSGVLTQATAERASLRPCLIEIALEQVVGPCRVLKQDGRFVDSAMPGQMIRGDIAVLLRTPLPVTLFKRIVFCNETDRETFEERAALAANVDTVGIPCEVDERMFETVPQPWPPSELRMNAPGPEGESERGAPNSIGGILALLYHTANRSDLAADAYASATGEKGSTPATPEPDPILRQLPLWFKRGLSIANADARAVAFWEFVDAVVQHQSQVSGPEFVDFAVAFFDEKAAASGDAELAAEWVHLVTILRKSTGLGEGSISELLEAAGAPISRAVVLVSLRSKVEEFMQLLDSLGNRYLNDSEEVLAAILFGARSGWMKLPRMMRGPRSLAALVVQRMAEVEQGTSGLRFTVSHRAPQPLRTLFQPWQAEHMEVALRLCQRLGWVDCLATRIELAGRKKLEDKEDYLVITGDSPVTETRVRKTRFLSRVGAWPPIDEEAEKETREQLAQA